MAKLLGEDLTVSYGVDKYDYNNYNIIELIDTVIVAYINNKPVGCGCFVKFNDEIAEIKRMYVLPEYRRKGISKKILSEIENWAINKQLKKAILKTSIYQPETLHFYKNAGYYNIPNYGPYKFKKSCICIEKILKQYQTSLNL